jgi:eukaryotic-like serine/threonine-protein kinase
VDGRYRLLERVGSGATADVYRAHDLRLGRTIALKVLHTRCAEDEPTVERFQREACTAARLGHPHIVCVYDCGAWDGTHYIAMEYARGCSLKSIIDREAPLHSVRAIDLAVQLLRAAGVVHRSGLIHRDLKPHNAIVDPEGRLKLTDFGIARDGLSDVTQTGAIVGTVRYLSPEQAMGHAVTAASDLYSIGIVLYELLTGRVPFEGETVVTIALKQVGECPVPPSAFNPAITVEIEAVVMRALQKDPRQRFANADDFIAALQRAARPKAVAPAMSASSALCA